MNNIGTSMQETLLRHYCEEADALLNEATDEASAEKAMDELCRRLEQQCESPLVLRGTKAHIRNVIRNRWKRLDESAD